jgi:hypothetical protein
MFSCLAVRLDICVVLADVPILCILSHTHWSVLPYHFLVAIAEAQDWSYWHLNLWVQERPTHKACYGPWNDDVCLGKLMFLNPSVAITVQQSVFWSLIRLFHGLPCSFPHQDSLNFVQIVQQTSSCKCICLLVLGFSLLQTSYHCSTDWALNAGRSVTGTVLSATLLWDIHEQLSSQPTNQTNIYRGRDGHCACSAESGPLHVLCSYLCLSVEMPWLRTSCSTISSRLRASLGWVLLVNGRLRCTGIMWRSLQQNVAII